MKIKALKFAFFLVFAVLIVSGVHAQVNIVPSPQNSPTGNSVECPGNVSSYSVPISTSDGSDPAKCSFVWRVYGGTITGVDGTIVSPISTTSASGTMQTYSTVTVDGNPTSGKSRITIRWDIPSGNTIVPAWIAVQENSQWGCSDGKWSIVNISLGDNTPPVITTGLSDIITCADNETDESANITNIKFDGTTSTSYLDNCSSVSDLIVTYAVVQGQTIIRSGTGIDAGGKFPEGTSTVTYTVSDKAGNQASKSFQITVNHKPRMSDIN